MQLVGRIFKPLYLIFNITSSLFKILGRTSFVIMSPKILNGIAYMKAEMLGYVPAFNPWYPCIMVRVFDLVMS